MRPCHKHYNYHNFGPDTDAMSFLDRDGTYCDDLLHPTIDPIPTGIEEFELSFGMDWVASEKYRKLLPGNLQDILIMYYEKRKTQSDIAKIFGCGQANICIAIHSAFKKMRWEMNLEKNVTYRILKALEAGNRMQRDIAKAAGISQPSVCSFFRKMHLPFYPGHKQWSENRKKKTLKEAA